MAIKTKEKAKKRQRRRYRIKKRIAASGMPRVSVFKSSKYTYAQVIDDEKRCTIACISTRNDDVMKAVEGESGKSVAAAKIAGKMLGEKLKEKGISQGVYDRSGFLYAGRVKALADGLRESGITL